MSELDGLQVVHGSLALIWRRPEGSEIEVLLQQRDSLARCCPDSHALWGGGRKSWETSGLQCMVRELREELSIHVHPDQLALLMQMDCVRRGISGKYRWIGDIYALRDTGFIFEQREGAGLIWVTRRNYLAVQPAIAIAAASILGAFFHQVYASVEHFD